MNTSSDHSRLLYFDLQFNSLKKKKKKKKVKMAGQGQDMRYKAGELTGQAQVKKDEVVNKASQAMDKMSNQNSGNIKDQATTFIQQTGEQVMNMAHGAADAVKNTLGMNTDNTNTNTNTNTNHPSNPSNRNQNLNNSPSYPSNDCNPTTRI